MHLRIVSLTNGLADKGDHGQYHVAEPQLRDRLRNLLGLLRLHHTVRMTRRDGAEPATPGASRSEQQDRRGSAAPALGDVGAPRRLADGVKLQVTQRLADTPVDFASRHPHSKPRRLPLE